MCAPCQVYYAYDIIYSSVLSPFSATHPMTLFNCSRFLLMRMLAREAPLGVSMVNVVYTLARHAMDLGAFKLARFTFNKLQVWGMLGFHCWVSMLIGRPHRPFCPLSVLSNALRDLDRTQNDCSRLAVWLSGTSSLALQRIKLNAACCTDLTHGPHVLSTDTGAAPRGASRGGPAVHPCALQALQ